MLARILPCRLHSWTDIFWQKSFYSLHCLQFILFYPTYPPTWLRVEAEWQERQARSEEKERARQAHAVYKLYSMLNRQTKEIYRWLLWMNETHLATEMKIKIEKFTTVSVQHLILKNCCRARTEFNKPSIEIETSHMPNVLRDGRQKYTFCVINGMSLSRRTMTLIDSCIRHLDSKAFFMSWLYRQRFIRRKIKLSNGTLESNIFHFVGSLAQMCD